jgi:hypothetical protein
MRALEDQFEEFPQDIPHNMCFTVGDGSDDPRIYVNEIDGSRKFASLRGSQLKNADIVVLCFDVSNLASFKELKSEVCAWSLMDAMLTSLRSG